MGAEFLEGRVRCGRVGPVIKGVSESLHVYDRVK